MRTFIVIFKRPRRLSYPEPDESSLLKFHFNIKTAPMISSSNQPVSFNSSHHKTLHISPSPDLCHMRDRFYHDSYDSNLTVSNLTQLGSLQFDAI